jgi:hypothetical protein
MLFFLCIRVRVGYSWVISFYPNIMVWHVAASFSARLTNGDIIRPRLLVLHCVAWLPRLYETESSAQICWIKPSTSFDTIPNSFHTRTFLEKLEDRACATSKTESLPNAIGAKRLMLRRPVLGTALSSLIT